MGPVSGQSIEEGISYWLRFLGLVAFACLGNKRFWILPSSVQMDVKNITFNKEIKLMKNRMYTQTPLLWTPWDQTLSVSEKSLYIRTVQ